MNVIKTKITDLLILEPKVFSDERGFFMESYNHNKFVDIIGRDVDFVQDNHTHSTKGVLRGLHFQADPCAQGKLVRCVVGEVYDVAVDLRIDSPTYKQWIGVVLSAENKKQFWIPEGFAHGFFVLSKTAEFLYKTTHFYSSLHERSIAYNDPQIAVEWPVADIKPILSGKDSEADFFSDNMAFR